MAANTTANTDPEDEEEEQEEELIYALDGEEGEEGEVLVLGLLSPEQAYAILDAEEEEDSDQVIRHNPYNPH
jgi:hypothetical protein